MKGSIQRKGKGWRIVVDAGIDPVTGKRRQIARSGIATKPEAQERLNALIGELRNGLHHGHDSSLGELITTWMTGATLSPSTRLDYGRAIRTHIPPPMMATAVWKLRTHDLDHLYGALAAGGVGAQRIRRVHNILRRALAQAVKWQWIARNPAVDASPPTTPRSQIHPPSPDDVRRLLATAEGQLEIFLRLAAHLGARRGELCALQWDDIDFETGEITIRRSRVESGPGKSIVTKSTKTDRNRTVALDPGIVAMLKSFRRECLAEAFSVSAPLGPWVFTVDKQHLQPIRPDSTTRQFAALCRKLGLQGVRLHDLRHFTATRLLAAGVDPRTVSGRVGHARTSTTLDMYAAFVPARDRDAAEIMGRLLG